MEKDMEQTPEETEAGKEPCQEADQETASKAETSETAEGEGTSGKDTEDQPEKKGFFGKKKEISFLLQEVRSWLCGRSFQNMENAFLQEFFLWKLPFVSAGSWDMAEGILLQCRARFQKK